MSLHHGGRGQRGHGEALHRGGRGGGCGIVESTKSTQVISSCWAEAGEEVQAVSRASCRSLGGQGGLLRGWNSLEEAKAVLRRLLDTSGRSREGGGEFSKAVITGFGDHVLIRVSESIELDVAVSRSSARVGVIVGVDNLPGLGLADAEQVLQDVVVHIALLMLLYCGGGLMKHMIV